MGVNNKNNPSINKLSESRKKMFYLPLSFSPKDIHFKCHILSSWEWKTRMGIITFCLWSGQFTLANDESDHLDVINIHEIRAEKTVEK